MSITPGIYLIAAYGGKCARDSSKVLIMPIILVPLDIVVVAIEGGRHLDAGWDERHRASMV